MRLSLSFQAAPRRQKPLEDSEGRTCRIKLPFQKGLLGLLEEKEAGGGSGWGQRGKQGDQRGMLVAWCRMAVVGMVRRDCVRGTDGHDYGLHLGGHFTFSPILMEKWRHRNVKKGAQDHIAKGTPRVVPRESVHLSPSGMRFLGAGYGYV